MGFEPYGYEFENCVWSCELMRPGEIAPSGQLTTVSPPVAQSQPTHVICSPSTST